MTMRVAAIVSLLVGLAAAWLADSLWRESAYGQSPLPRHLEQQVAAGQLIALSSDVSQTHQQVTVVDPASRVMSVYHIERGSGEITLKSVRNIHWDLQMEDFNGVNPSPREIRSLLQKR